VDPAVIQFNRVVLLHGPPGTGKTSLCRALAQRLAVRHRRRFPRAHFVEVNAHSLFSRWFSESGKLVSRLFGKISEVVEDPDALVFVLIDEVESLTAARKAAVAGSEPSDAVRVVNALLTQLDALRANPNVLILTTSNLVDAIDLAFVDRADIKAFVGPPGLSTRYAILRSAVLELCRKHVVSRPAALPARDGWGRPQLPPVSPLPTAAPPGFSPPSPASQTEAEEALLLQALPPHSMLGTVAEQTTPAIRLLLQCAAETEGLSGRALRKLPFLAYAELSLDDNDAEVEEDAGAGAGAPPHAPFPCERFLETLVNAAVGEQRTRSHLPCA